MSSLDEVIKICDSSQSFIHILQIDILEHVVHQNCFDVEAFNVVNFFCQTCERKKMIQKVSFLFHSFVGVSFHHSSLSLCLSVFSALLTLQVPNAISVGIKKDFRFNAIDWRFLPPIQFGDSRTSRRNAKDYASGNYHGQPEELQVILLYLHIFDS